MTPTPPVPEKDYVDWGSGELLAMTALDAYPIDDGLPKSTSVVFRIHQLGRALTAETQARQEAERDAIGSRDELNILKVKHEAESLARQQAERAREELRTALEEAGESIHSEYCTATHHAKCVAVTAALSAVLGQETTTTRDLRPHLHDVDRTIDCWCGAIPGQPHRVTR